MSKTIVLALVIGAASLVGCDKKAETPPEGKSGATETAAKLSDDDVPVKGDFVEEAEGAITPANYKEELSKEEAEKE